MKVEVELSHIEHLNYRIKVLEADLKEREERLKSLSEDELIKKAVNLGYRLFENYIASTFRHLGFDVPYRAVVINDNLDHYIGKDWFDKDERIKMELHGEVSEKFRAAFLNIGMIPREQVKDKITL